MKLETTFGGKNAFKQGKSVFYASSARVWRRTRSNPVVSLLGSPALHAVSRAVEHGTDLLCRVTLQVHSKHDGVVMGRVRRWSSNHAGRLDRSRDSRRWRAECWTSHYCSFRLRGR